MIVAAAVALVAATAAAVTRSTGVPARTTRRWLRWWRGPFTASAPFVELSARLVPAPERRRMPAVADRAARRRAPRRRRKAPRVAGADHHDELPGRIALFEGRDVAARPDTVRAEDGAARVFPFGVAFRARLRSFAAAPESHGQRRPRAERARAMGTSALSDPRSAPGGAGGRRRAQSAHRGARRAPVATPDHRRVDPLLVQDPRALVVHRPRRGRPAGRARAQGALARRHAPESRRRARSRRSHASIATTRAGASSSITTTSSRLPARIHASGPCPATRRYAAT